MEIAVDPLQYQAIPIHLQFTNRSSEAIRVTQAEPSCGCTDLVTRGGSALLAPLVLSPGESLPWQATIHTEGRIGPQSFLVRLETESGGETVEHISTIRMNVKPAVAVAPARIEFADVMPGALESAEITLWDGHPDPGLRLKTESRSRTLSGWKSNITLLIHGTAVLRERQVQRPASPSPHGTQ